MAGLYAECVRRVVLRDVLRMAARRRMLRRVCERRGGVLRMNVDVLVERMVNEILQHAALIQEVEVVHTEAKRARERKSQQMAAELLQYLLDCCYNGWDATPDSEFYWAVSGVPSTQVPSERPVSSYIEYEAEDKYRECVRELQRALTNSDWLQKV